MTETPTCRVENGRILSLCDRMRAMRERQIITRNPNFGFLGATPVPAFRLVTWDRPSIDAEPINHCPFCGQNLKG